VEIEEQYGVWTSAQWKAIEWFASPRYDRIPPTADMLADELGVDRVTLWRWKKKDEFQAEVNRLARKAIGIKLPELYGALVREAEAGSFQHLQLAFEMAGEYTKQQRNINEESGEIKLVIKTEGTTTIPPHLASRATEGNEEG